MTDTAPDIIDTLAGSPPAHGLRREVAREQAQASFDALFSPYDDSAFALRDRWLVAAFATRLTADDVTAAFYAERAQETDAAAAATVIAEAVAHATEGPYGRYAEAGLAAENVEGPRYEGSGIRPVVGERLAAALEYAHLLTYRPREASGGSHNRLFDAGWTVDGIVTLSQLIAFLAFQQRVVRGLRALNEEVAA